MQELSDRLRRQDMSEALGHLEQAQSAFSRGEWEGANAQGRAFLESLFNRIAFIRLSTRSTGGAARKALEQAGVLREREARLIQEFMAVAGAAGSHAGVSNADEAKGRVLASIGMAYLGLALIPELVRVEDVIRMSLTAPPNTQLPGDGGIFTSCPTCGEKQTLAEGTVRRDDLDTVYTCRNGCQTIAVVSAPGDTPWPGRGYRLGEHVIRNASDIVLRLVGGVSPGIVIPASKAALMKRK